MAASDGIHDLLVIPINKNLYRFRADADGFGNQQPMSPYADEYRQIMSIARPGTSGQSCGPAFAVLPNKPDPSTSQVCCYLVNSENIRAENPWTSDAWSSEPTATDDGLDLEPNARDTEPLDFVAAGPGGKLWRIRAGQQPSEIDASQESEIFALLRNGLVAGAAFCRAAARVLPLVNVTSLFPKGGV